MFTIKKIVKRVWPKKSKPPLELTPFGKRIQERHFNFWHQNYPGIHDAETCRNELLTRDDPLSSWHCCPLWQRKLSNKWNAREFAAKFDCQIPALYWHGRDVASFDFASLPPYYVVRPTIGHSTGGIFVMADRVNLLDGRSYDEAALKSQLTQTVSRDPRVTILVEEFVKGEDGEYRLPTDYKLLMFGGKVGAIGAIRRLSRKEIKKRYYPEDWSEFPEPIIISNAQKVRDGVAPPPKCLPGIIADAKRLSEVYGIFVRVDFYATDRGSVFGEFTPTPAMGRSFTDFASRYFLELWNEAYPEPNSSAAS